MKIKNNKIFIYFIYIFFFNISLINNAFSLENNFNKYEYCNELEFKKSINLNPKNFESFNLYLDIKNQKKWNKIILTDEINRKKENRDKFYFYTKKKRVDAIFLLSIKKIKCKLIAEVRPHGDLYDHRIGSGLPSLNVKLKNGHIFGIVEFILFRPVTRNFDNEVFTTTLYRQLNLLAPRSANIIVNYKDISEKFIFQEKINKEFLENSNLREGPIFEGDERFHNIDHPRTKNLSKHRITNFSWSARSFANLISSQYSLAILNKVNQFHFITNSKLTELDVVDYYTVSKKVFQNDFFSELPIFDALNLILSADHGLSREDRRFYFDQYYKKFLPIYYDGMVRTLSIFNNIELNTRENLVRTIGFLNLDNGTVTPSSVEGASKVFNLLNKLDIKEFQNKLSKNGVDLNLNKSNEIIEILKKRSLILQNVDRGKILQIDGDLSIKSYIKESFSENISNRRLIYYNKEFNGFVSCNLFGNSCDDINLDKKQLTKAIAQDLKIGKNNYIFIGKTKTVKPIDGWFDQSILFKKNIFISQNIEKNTFLTAINEDKFDIDKDKKNIILTRNTQDSRFIIHGGELKNWNIKLIDNTNEESLGADFNGLTGCVTFLDLQLNDINISSQQSNCEDAFNFIRVKGHINSTLISNSKFDAIDADFSNLAFEKIEVKKSNNDCLDFSYGLYNLKNVVLINCGDKGLSVGENSIVNVQRIEITEAVSGVASKDYSTTELQNITLKKVNTCFEAYNKKQEFSGAILNINRMYCEATQKQNNVDNVSIINIKN